MPPAPEGATRSLSLNEARHVWGPLADALALDQEFTALHARDELGWIPRAAGVLEYLGGFCGPRPVTDPAA